MRAGGLTQTLIKSQRDMILTDQGFHLKEEQYRQFLEAIYGQYIRQIFCLFKKCLVRNMKMHENEGGRAHSYALQSYLDILSKIFPGDFGELSSSGRSSGRSIPFAWSILVKSTSSESCASCDSEVPGQLSVGSMLIGLTFDLIPSQKVTSYDPVD